MSTAHLSRRAFPAPHQPVAENTRRHSARYGLAFFALAVFDGLFLLGTHGLAERVGIVVLLGVNMAFVCRAAMNWRVAK